jgi:hypothetical protein
MLARADVLKSVAASTAAAAAAVIRRVDGRLSLARRRRRFGMAAARGRMCVPVVMVIRSSLLPCVGHSCSRGPVARDSGVVGDPVEKILLKQALGLVPDEAGPPGRVAVCDPGGDAAGHRFQVASLNRLSKALGGVGAGHGLSSFR